MTLQSANADLGALALRRWFEELSDCGIFTTDDALIIRSWNPWLEAQTGIPAADAIGRPLCDLYPGLVERGLDHYYRDALGGAIRVLAERFHRYFIPISRNVHATGFTEMAQSARIAPLNWEGRIVGTITVIEDVTDRVANERELRSQIAVSEDARAAAEEASQLKDEFLATLSHEIRTPLNAVLGWARVLRTQPNISSHGRALEVIERNATAQLRLVEDLLDTARIISGKLRLDVKAVVLGDVVRAAVEVMEPAAAAKKIAIRTTLAPGLPLVSGDADRLQQVVWNVMSNAVKFTQPGGEIEVTLARNGDALELVVRDNGQGIAREFLPHVFERFRQADGSPSRRHGGLGLGLALVRQLVELQGGKAVVQSAGVDRGSTFSIRLPISTAASAAAQKPAGDSPVVLNGLVAMVVDDDEDGRDMLTTLLRGYGATVHAVATADEAWTLLSDGRTLPDILLADIGMPGTDGYELIRRARHADSSRLRQLPAIAVTAYANPDDRIRALTAGYQAHIAKPLDPLSVVARIASLVAQGRPQKH